jgi:hypothetical protein
MAENGDGRVAFGEQRDEGEQRTKNQAKKKKKKP